MKRLLVAAAAVAITFGLGACAPDPTETSSQTPEASESETISGEFPVTIETKFGDVTIEEQPVRVVALGWGDAETALSLGTQPVGASDWLGFGGEGVGPWAEGLYDSAPEILGTTELSYEAIAALEPDLILDVKSSGEQDRYDRLSQIAPTVGVPEDGDAYLATQEQQMTMIASALGQSELGETLLQQVADEFTEEAAAHPQWEGMTMSAATKTADGWGAYIEGSERVTFMENLGFVQNPSIAELPPAETGFSVSISAENLDVIDADVIVAFPIFIETSDLTEDSAWQAVPAVADGHSVVIDGDLAAAYSLGSTMATSYAIEAMIPMLEAATPQ